MSLNKARGLQREQNKEAGDLVFLGWVRSGSLWFISKVGWKEADRPILVVCCPVSCAWWRHHSSSWQNGLHQAYKKLKSCASKPNMHATRGEGWRHAPNGMGWRSGNATEANHFTHLDGWSSSAGLNSLGISPMNKPCWNKWEMCKYTLCTGKLLACLWLDYYQWMSPYSPS